MRAELPYNFGTKLHQKHLATFITPASKIIDIATVPIRKSDHNRFHSIANVSVWHHQYREIAQKHIYWYFNFFGGLKALNSYVDDQLGPCANISIFPPVTTHYGVTHYLGCTSNSWLMRCLIDRCRLHTTILSIQSDTIAAAFVLSSHLSWWESIFFTYSRAKKSFKPTFFVDFSHRLKRNHRLKCGVIYGLVPRDNLPPSIHHVHNRSKQGRRWEEGRGRRSAKNHDRKTGLALPHLHAHKIDLPRWLAEDLSATTFEIKITV